MVVAVVMMMTVMGVMTLAVPRSERTHGRPCKREPSYGTVGVVVVVVVVVPYVPILLFFHDIFHSDTSREK